MVAAAPEFREERGMQPRRTQAAKGRNIADVNFHFTKGYAPGQGT
jgi:hypothetical protein